MISKRQELNRKLLHIAREAAAKTSKEYYLYGKYAFATYGRRMGSGRVFMADVPKVRRWFKEDQENLKWRGGSPFKEKNIIFVPVT